MRIESLRLENFRAFDDAQFVLNPYTCLVGDNGCGKSSVLAALCVFFGDTESTPYAGVLEKADYHAFDTSKPIRITVTFTALDAGAMTSLKAYARNGKLVVTAVAVFDDDAGHGKVVHYGTRLGIDAFRPYFEADKLGQSATELKELYKLIRNSYPDLPAVWKKPEMHAALRAYEDANQAKCSSIESADNFYGINSLGILRPHVQWLLVPAVKDAADEAQEARRTALTQLIARLVRVKTTFGTDIEKLKAKAERVYRRLLTRNSTALSALAGSLDARVKAWAHGGVSVGLDWLFDANKSVTVREPIAGVHAGDDRFTGSVWRMGHGLQRVYLLALLQELAETQSDPVPTLILGFEEPELYQHPPQARHMADVLETLVGNRYQALVTTHSPCFVSGDGFENVRIVRRKAGKGTEVAGTSHADVIASIRTLRGEDTSAKLGGNISRIHQVLAPAAAEMFFCRSVVLVEGMSDISYVTTYMQLSGRWQEFRRRGGHIACAGGKSWLLELAVIADKLKIPAYIIWDADGSCQGKSGQGAHQKDNLSFQSLVGKAGGAFPTADDIGKTYAVWSEDLDTSVAKSMPASIKYKETVRTTYGQTGGFEKFDMFIADWLSLAWDAGERSALLEDLCDKILAHVLASACAVAGPAAAAAAGAAPTAGTGKGASDPAATRSEPDLGSKLAPSSDGGGAPLRSDEPTV